MQESGLQSRPFLPGTGSLVHSSPTGTEHDARAERHTATNPVTRRATDVFIDNPPLPQHHGWATASTPGVCTVDCLCLRRRVHARRRQQAARDRASCDHESGGHRDARGRGQQCGLLISRAAEGRQGREQRSPAPSRGALHSRRASPIRGGDNLLSTLRPRDNRLPSSISLQFVRSPAVQPDRDVAGVDSLFSRRLQSPWNKERSPRRADSSPANVLPSNALH